LLVVSGLEFGIPNFYGNHDKNGRVFPTIQNILQTVNISILEDCVNSEQKLEQRLCVPLRLPQRASAFKSKGRGNTVRLR
jgi:hypothetical protein